MFFLGGINGATIMHKDNSEKFYQGFDESTGYPAGSNLFYECLRCGDVIPSLPNESSHCKCRNVMIDVDYGRVKVQDKSKAKLFSTKKS